MFSDANFILEEITIVENYAILEYDIYTSEGMSGSPCYDQIDETHFNVVGFHTMRFGLRNYATKTTKTIVKWFN